MFKRTEDKILFNQNKYLEILNWINNNDGKILYPERKVESIYYDNKFYGMYHDSNEGIVPRKKIRIRYYNNDKTKIFEEKKINSIDGRYKFSKKLTKNFPNKIKDLDYGLCEPKILVSYERAYYLIKNKRVTLDKKISYKEYKKNIIVNDYDNVFEIKYKNNDDQLIFENLSPELSRFSKYCRAIEKLKIV